MKKIEWNQAVLKEVKEYIHMIIFVVIVVFVVNNVVLINAKIPSESMEETIMTNDRIFGFRLAYKFDQPKRYDVIIFKYPDNPENCLLSVSSGCRERRYPCGREKSISMIRKNL